MARRSAQTAARVSAHSQNSASDLEVDESQRVLAFSQFLRTPKPNKKELQAFKSKVAGDQQELGALFERRKSQACVPVVLISLLAKAHVDSEEAALRRRGELTRSILDALQTPNRPVHSTPPTLADTNIARNAVLKSVASIIAASENLVHEYDRLDKMVAGMQDAESDGIAEAWTEDVETTARLLNIGAETAIKNVKTVLGARIEVDDTLAMEEESEGMDGVKKMELNYNLQTSLYHTERGVKKMVKGLSQDEGH